MLLWPGIERESSSIESRYQFDNVTFLIKIHIPSISSPIFTTVCAHYPFVILEFALCSAMFLITQDLYPRGICAPA